MKRQSVIRRVTLYYAGALILILALVLGMLFLIGERMLITSSRPQVEQAVRDAFDHIRFDEDEIVVGTGLDLFTEGVQLLVYDARGNLVLGTVPTYFPPATPLVSGRHQVVTDPSDTVHQWNVYDMLVNYRSTGIWVRGIYSVSGTAGFLQNLIRGALILLPVLCIASILLGYLITRRAFRPIRQINETVNAIQGSNDLDRRIELEGGRHDEITELADNFNSLFGRLQQRFEAEQQFTSDASHELRTPVAAIIAQAEHGLDPQATEKERLHALERVLFQARGMSAMVNQLLLLTRADRQNVQLEKERLDLGELCEIITESLEAEAKAKGIRLVSRTDEDVYVMGDQQLLTRLIMNLVTNGIKYNKPQGFVMLDLAKQAGEAILTVSDSGVGIPAEALPRIFDRFYRVSKTRNRREAEYSTGLGLSIVKWAVEAHLQSQGEFAVPGYLRTGKQSASPGDARFDIPV